MLILTQDKEKLNSQVGGNQKFNELEVKFNQQTQELNELMRHLATAEDYIKQNSEIWEKAGEAYEILPEKEAIIEMLKKDLELYRRQN